MYAMWHFIEAVVGATVDHWTAFWWSGVAWTPQG
jgi:hypothetical protein